VTRLGAPGRRRYGPAPASAYEQVIVDVVFFAGELESRTTRVVGPLPVSKPVIDVEPPLVDTVCGVAIPRVALTL